MCRDGCNIDVIVDGVKIVSDVCIGGDNDGVSNGMHIYNINMFEFCIINILCIVNIRLF
jgi:hypothetical protein